MANQWFKFFGGEYLADPKMGRLSPAERSCWLTLLCMASQTGGVIEYLTVDDLLEKSGIRWNPYDEGDWEKCQSVLQKFSQLKMIKVDPDESRIEVVNWLKRQENTAQTPYERVKKWRETKKKSLNDNEMITHDNADDNGRIEENRIEENRIDIIQGDNVAIAPTPTKKFKEPSFEDVEAYCIERKNNVNPRKFIDFYASKGWMVGKNKMKDWKACVRTWESPDNKTQVYKNNETENQRSEKMNKILSKVITAQQ